jgi:hypothetical protein
LTVCTGRSGSYCRITVNPSVGVTAEVSGSFAANLGLTTVAYSTEVKALPPTVDGLAGTTGPNGEKRWTAEYTAVSISTHLTITLSIPPLEPVKLQESAVDLRLASVGAHACAGQTCGA